LNKLNQQTVTKKDFFRLILKLFGLYIAISLIISVFPGNVSLLLYHYDIIEIIWFIVSIVFIYFIFRFLFFKTDKIIQRLKLDKGFDEDKFEFQNFNSESILKLATIVTGGLLLINNIPVFLGNVLYFIKYTVFISQWVSFGESFFKVVIGYLILTNYNKVSKLLKTKSTEEE
jgi:uncharacterized protein YacL